MILVSIFIDCLFFCHQVALSGTAEMALGGYFCGKVLPRSELPGKMCAVSRFENNDQFPDL